MRMFLPMEVVTMPQRIKVVEFGSLIEIPCELQVRQAISNLRKQQSDYPDKFSYIKFPFGIIGYDGLDMLLKYHEYITLKKKVAEDWWLERTLNLYSIYMFLWSHDVVAMLVKLLFFVCILI